MDLFTAANIGLRTAQGVSSSSRKNQRREPTNEELALRRWFFEENRQRNGLKADYLVPWYYDEEADPKIREAYTTFVSQERQKPIFPPEEQERLRQKYESRSFKTVIERLKELQEPLLLLQIELANGYRLSGSRPQELVQLEFARTKARMDFLVELAVEKLKNELSQMTPQQLDKKEEELQTEYRNTQRYLETKRGISQSRPSDRQYTVLFFPPLEKQIQAVRDAKESLKQAKLTGLRQNIGALSSTLGKTITGTVFTYPEGIKAYLEAAKLSSGLKEELDRLKQQKAAAVNIRNKEAIQKKIEAFKANPMTNATGLGSYVQDVLRTWSAENGNARKANLDLISNEEDMTRVLEALKDYMYIQKVAKFEAERNRIDPETAKKLDEMSSWYIQTFKRIYQEAIQAKREEMDPAEAMDLQLKMAKDIRDMFTEKARIRDRYKQFELQAQIDASKLLLDLTKSQPPSEPSSVPPPVPPSPTPPEPSPPLTRANRVRLMTGKGGKRQTRRHRKTKRHTRKH